MKKRTFLSLILILLLTGCTGMIPNRTAETAEPAPGLEAEQDEDAYHSAVPDSDPSAKSPVPEAQKEESEELTALADEILSPSMSEYEKVKAIHDYLVIHVNYDYDNLAAGTLPHSAFTKEGALLLHSAVCEGYARAFSWLCERADIEEQLVYGTADDGTGIQTHAWNQVRVDDEWYHVDVTWDDPLINGQPVTDGSNMTYEYFLVPDEKLLKNHTPDTPAKLHACTSDRYLEENRHLTIAPYLAEPYSFAASDTEVQDAVRQYLSQGIHTFQLVCDVTSHAPEERSELVLNQVKEAMTVREEYGQISVETQYGIADYAVISVTITQ